MIKLRLSTDAARALRQIRRNIGQMEDRLNNAMLGKKGRLANKALRQITREPGPPIYPLRWASARQRRAFFATQGFGKGIPTRRTGALLDSWQVTYTPDRNGGVIALENPVAYMPYVQGEQAQPFHRDTGYVQVDDVVDDFYKEVDAVVVETYFTAANPLEGLA